MYTLIIKGSGYKLSDKDEIISSETNEIIKRTVMARKFKRFITEVSTGTAFTFFEYPIYGTTSDSSGIKTDNQYIASPEKSSVRNLNITTMVNFNYFIPNSNIHPLFQIGIGVNSGMPTLLSGVGLRLTGIGSVSKSKESHRVAITGGIAMTWIKELDKLKVGDQVSGTADIENDLKYQFSWPPRLYIGLQYSF